VSSSAEAPEPGARRPSLLRRVFGQKVTLAEYNALSEGMSYEDAVGIIGEPGEELSRTDLAGYTTVMYQWPNTNGSNMNAMFQNDQLVSKAQFGLK
jgi:hypothetical protein